MAGGTFRPEGRAAPGSTSLYWLDLLMKEKAEETPMSMKYEPHWLRRMHLILCGLLG